MRLAFAIAVLAVGAPGQDTGVPVRMVVTVEPHHGTQSPRRTRDDVMVFQDKDNRRPVIGWTPVRDAGLQLWVLIDDGADSTIGNQFGDLRKFILAQPSTVEIGLGYMHNGGVTAVRSLTTDHQSVAKGLRLPFGEAGISGSPYLSLVDLIHKWPVTQRAREAVMITSGTDYIYGPAPTIRTCSRRSMKRSAPALLSARSISVRRVTQATATFKSTGAKIISPNSPMPQAASSTGRG